MPHDTLANAPAAVLDTNVVLDWLVFDDASVQPLAHAIVGRHVRWLASAAMRAELAGVLHRPGVRRRVMHSERALSDFDRWAFPCAAPGVAAEHGLRCADADDQCFIDLALAQGARWLVTRDKALLALRRAAARSGLDVLGPGDWPLAY